jgi:multicomponent Na+:H+ antiporter subunit G
MSLVGQVLAVIGGLLLVFAAYGVIALPDALARQHAATKAGTLALALICLGAMLMIGEAAWTGRLLVILAVLLATLPVASHMLARAAVREREDEIGPTLRDAPRVAGNEVAGKAVAVKGDKADEKSGGVAPDLSGADR